MTLALIAYFGPETVMPMTSIIATVAAMLMMFGRSMWRMLIGGLYLLKGLGRKPRQAPSSPHFSLQNAQAGTSHEEARQPAESLRS